MQLPRYGQLSISGNIVNVPADVKSTVTEDETILLKFQRSLNFNHFVSFERIRPNSAECSKMAC